MARWDRRQREAGLAAVEREKILDVDASMQGTLTFRDPVNLRINGKFDGSLDTKGTLTIGAAAMVAANIRGEHVIVAGRVEGDIVADGSLRVLATGRVVGNVKTVQLVIEAGAIFRGQCEMLEAAALRGGGAEAGARDLMSLEDVARYLEVDADSVLEWASQRRIPAVQEGVTWRFEKAQVDAWVAQEKSR